MATTALTVVCACCLSEVHVDDARLQRLAAANDVPIAVVEAERRALLATLPEAPDGRRLLLCETCAPEVAQVMWDRRVAAGCTHQLVQSHDVNARVM